MSFWDHMATGATTVARAWLVTRRDGLTLGFTDHDRPLEFAGARFEPSAGFTARALALSTGLSVDNTEAYGALSSEAIREEDILAGRYDGAKVRAWLVNWADPASHVLRFSGSLGELTRSGGAFTAELRGLSAALNAPMGRAYQPRCSAVLGDGTCRADLGLPGFREEVTVLAVAGAVLTLASGAEAGWFRHGRVEGLSGAAQGLGAMVKEDRTGEAGRELVLWTELGGLAAGDLVRLEAGCDRAAETCRLKFSNFLNFRGFPHIPGEDWLMAVPKPA